MTEKVCVVTGATSGLGRAAALDLARLGARVVLVGRNQSAAGKVIAQIKNIPGAADAEFLRADLSNFRDVRALASGFRHQRVDVLVNNAGARFSTYHANSDGFELTFATNHLGHYLLTMLLMDRLMAAPAARVITIGSGAHGAAPIEGESWIVGANHYDRKTSYARSKLANIMFAYELARRLRGTSVTSNAVDPGGVATKLGRNNGLIPWFRHLVYYGLKGELQSARRAAKTITFLASSEDVAGMTGKYFHGRREIQSSPVSMDLEAAESLWKYSADLTGEDLPGSREFRRKSF